MIVCSVFCLNRSEAPISAELLGHVIQILSSALGSQFNTAVRTVLQRTKSVFTLDYRGLLVLVPHYMEQIEKAVRGNVVVAEKRSSKSEEVFPSITTNAAVSILASLVALADYYEGYVVASSRSEISMLELKKNSYDLVTYILDKYISTLNSDKAYLKAINKAICCATIIVYQEAVKEKPRVEIIKVYLL